MGLRRADSKGWGGTGGGVPRFVLFHILERCLKFLIVGMSYLQ